MGSHQINLYSPSLWRNCMFWWHPCHLFSLKYHFLVPNVMVILLHRTLPNIHIQLWICFTSTYKVNFWLVLNKDLFLKFSFMLFFKFCCCWESFNKEKLKQVFQNCPCSCDCGWEWKQTQPYTDLVVYFTFSLPCITVQLLKYKQINAHNCIIFTIILL